MPVHDLGNRSVGFTLHEKSNGYAITLVIVIFTRGSTAVAMSGSGLTGGFSPQQVIALARIIDRRLVHGR